MEILTSFFVWLAVFFCSSLLVCTAFDFGSGEFKWEANLLASLFVSILGSIAYTAYLFI